MANLFCAGYSVQWRLHCSLITIILNALETLHIILKSFGLHDAKIVLYAMYVWVRVRVRLCVFICVCESTCACIGANQMMLGHAGVLQMHCL